MKIYMFLIIVLFVSLVLHGQDIDNIDFDNLNGSTEWQLKFQDECTENWGSKWFLDGLRANVTNTEKGMVFSAGSVGRDDACHAVLWTKDSFRGDVKIEYNYTRTDARTIWVNILYIQATGTGEGPYLSDISEWNDLRIIPSMKTYFMNMNALHISYAAFGNSPDDKRDYVRVRRYPVNAEHTFAETEIPPASFNTGLFNPGETYKITVIKTSKKLYFKAAGKHDTKLYSWDLTESKPVIEGRIGLRHMFTRSAMYKNFKVSVR